MELSRVKRSRLVALAWCLVALVALPGCGAAPDPWANQPGPPRVVVMFAPLYCFAKQVGGDDIAVRCVCKTTGPHDFHVNPAQDLLPLRQADLLFYNGYQLDDSLAHALLKVNKQKQPPVESIPVAERAVPREGGPLKPIPYASLSKEKMPSHTHGDYDPHVWLGLPEAMSMVKVVRDALKTQDPGRAEAYESRAKKYLERLDKLYETNKEALKLPGDEKLRVIANHDSLYYFARAFDMELVNVIGKPGSDPEPTRLQQLVDMCVAKPVHVIAIEPQYPKKAAEAILNELRKPGRNLTILPEIVEIDPLETASDTDLLDPDWFEKKMQANIDRFVSVKKKLVP